MRNLYLILVLLLLSVPIMALWNSVLDNRIYWQDILLEYQRSNFEVKSLNIEMEQNIKKIRDIKI